MAATMTIPFAVQHEGMENEGRWVLAVQGNRVLLSNAQGEMYWHPLDQCKLVRVATPDNPRLVMPVQPQQKIATPGLTPEMLKRGI